MREEIKEWIRFVVILAIIALSMAATTGCSSLSLRRVREVSVKAIHAWEKTEKNVSKVLSNYEKALEFVLKVSGKSAAEKALIRKKAKELASAIRRGILIVKKAVEAIKAALDIIDMSGGKEEKKDARRGNEGRGREVAEAGRRGRRRAGFPDRGPRLHRH